MPDTPPNGDIPVELIGFKYPLPHLTQALQGSGPVRIVAMGSSSTSGRADVVPYPHRLEMYLRAQYQQRFPNVRIDVLNRGKGGEEADAELLRFDTDIFAEKPSLVIWQVGTNAVFHKKDKPYDLDEVAAKVAVGLERLRGQPMDVVLMDPQYVTAMLLDERAEDSERMVALIAAAAKKANVNLFRRWALMRHWHVQNSIGFDQMLDPTDIPDKLHQSDWSTQRISVALCDAITKAPPATA
jgi:GDSL-like lipase/acylhydrolase family protein